MQADTVKKVRFFEATAAAGVVSSQSVTIPLRFPMAVDEVLLKSVGNDHHLFYHHYVSPTGDPAVFNVHATRTGTGDWAPHLVYVGIRIEK
jgi:hypothetical protein